MRSRRARLTAGGDTWDLRPLRGSGKPVVHIPLPSREIDVRRKLDWDLGALVGALRDGRETYAWELVREARALVARLPRGSAASQRRRIELAEVLLRSSSWRAQAAAIRHKRVDR